MALQAVSASLLTQQVITDMPTFDFQWPLRRTVSKEETASGTLHLSGAPDRWDDAIQDGGAVIACFDDADPQQAIIWAGYVTSSVRDAASNDVPVSLATFEAVLDRAPVGDVTYYSTQHRDDVIADLIMSWFTPKTGITLNLSYTPGGGPLLPVMDTPPVPNAAIIMQNTDNASVKARMEQVFAQLGGEYTIEWSWGNSGRALIPTLVFGDRIGSAAPAGRGPSVTFEMPGSLQSFTQTRDYSQGAGANQVYAYSSGQGSSTPYSNVVNWPTEGRPVFQYRYQPAASVSPSALNGYAQQAIKVLGPGARPITMSAALARADGRRLGVDWFLGDDIGYSVAGDYTNETGETVSVLAFPGGISGVGRAVGIELTDTLVTPILADAAVYSQ